MIGGAVGDSTYNAQLAGVIGKNTVENNYLSVQQIQQFDQEMGNCKNNKNCEKQIEEKYGAIALEQDKELAAICSVNAALCKSKYGFLVASRLELKKALDNTKNLSALYEGGLFSQQIDAEGFVFNVELARQFKNKYNITDEQATLLAMVASSVGVGKSIKGKGSTGSKYPVPEPIKADNGLIYKSNSKHTLGGEGNRANAGIEPKNSLELFEKSISITGNSNKRFTIDSKGNIHQFTYEGTGSNTYHWAGSSGDARNPLKLDNKTKAILRKNGWKSEALK